MLVETGFRLVTLVKTFIFVSFITVYNEKITLVTLWS